MVAIEPAPPLPNNGTHRSCWFDGNGHRVCADWSEQAHNLTDIHREGGVADLHNEHSHNTTGNIHGVTFQPTSEPSHPDASFEQHASDAAAGFRDAHEDAEESSDHEEDSGHRDQSWRYNSTSSSPTKDGNDNNHEGGKKAAEDFWTEDESHHLSDQKTDRLQNTTDTSQVDSEHGAFSAEYEKGAGEEGKFVGTHDAEHQMEEHADAKGVDGPVFDLHEESREETVASGSFDTWGGLEEVTKDWGERMGGSRPLGMGMGMGGWKRGVVDGSGEKGEVHRGCAALMVLFVLVVVVVGVTVGSVRKGRKGRARRVGRERKREREALLEGGEKGGTSSGNEEER